MDVCVLRCNFWVYAHSNIREVMKKMVERFRVKIPSEYIERLKVYQAQMDDIEREIERAARAGLDVEEMRARLKLAREKISKILAEYG